MNEITATTPWISATDLGTDFLDKSRVKRKNPTNATIINNTKLTTGELPAEFMVKIISRTKAEAASTPCVNTIGFEVCLLPKTAIKFIKPKTAARANNITLMISIILFLFVFYIQ